MDRAETRRRQQDAMQNALEVANRHGGALAALRLRGIDNLGDGMGTAAFGAFMLAPATSVERIAELVAFGFLARDLMAEGDLAHLDLVMAKHHGTAAH